MRLPYNKDTDIDIFTNEYTEKLSINRSMNRLLGNDTYLNGAFDSSVNRATLLKLASRLEVSNLSSSPSGAIVPSTIMVLSATEAETLTGIGAGVERFITPNTFASVFTNNNLLPNVMYIDIAHNGAMINSTQIKQSALAEIDGFEVPINTIIYTRYVDSDGADRVYTFKSSGGVIPWLDVRDRETYRLISRPS